jgi:hypothetical protein
VSPRARRNPLEGGVSPRARRNPLEGAFDWATPVGGGGRRGVGRALCVCLSKMCVLFLFFQVLSRIPLFFLPSGCPRHKNQNFCMDSADFKSILHTEWKEVSGIQ